MCLYVFTLFTKCLFYFYRGQRPVEWGDFPSVHSPLPPPPLWAIQPGLMPSQPARPVAQPARPEALAPLPKRSCNHDLSLSSSFHEYYFVCQISSASFPLAPLFFYFLFQQCSFNRLPNIHLGILLICNLVFLFSIPTMLFCLPNFLGILSICALVFLLKC